MSNRFSKEIAKKICDRLASGETLQSICKTKGYPKVQTVITWALGNQKTAKAAGFPEHYAQARLIGYHVMADQCLGIADDGLNDWVENNKGEKVLDHEHVQRSRLRLDTRKWLLAKCLPKIYGDKINPDTSEEESESLTINFNVANPKGEIKITRGKKNNDA